MTKKVKINRTYGKVPFLWEALWEYPDMTKIQIILDDCADFKTSMKIYENRDRTSIVPIQKNDLILKMFDDGRDVSVSLFTIRHIENIVNSATIELINRFEFDSDTVTAKDIQDGFVNNVKNEKQRKSLEYIMPLALLKLKKKQSSILFSRVSNGNVGNSNINDE